MCVCVYMYVYIYIYIYIYNINWKNNNILADLIVDLVFLMWNIISYSSSSFDLGLQYDPVISWQFS